MYAFIVYDKVKNQILINRDPQGEKIIYIFEDNNEIIFFRINSIVHYKNIKLNINILKNYFYTRHFTQFDKQFSKILKF